MKNYVKTLNEWQNSIMVQRHSDRHRNGGNAKLMREI
jgi:hypothetical protein